MRRSEDRCEAVTTHHATGMTTGPLQIQPDTLREGLVEHYWTRRHQRTNRGGGQGRGERSKERARQAGEATPTHQKQRRAKQPRKRQQQQPKANRNPQHHEDTTKKARRPKDTDNQSRPKQITGRRANKVRGRLKESCLISWQRLQCFKSSLGSNVAVALVGNYSAGP